MASAAGIGQANGLASFGIQEEERLGLLGSGLVGRGAALDHVALGVTVARGLNLVRKSRFKNPCGWKGV